MIVVSDIRLRRTDNTTLTYYNTADITDDTASYWVNILNDTRDHLKKCSAQVFSGSTHT